MRRAIPGLLALALVWGCGDEGAAGAADAGPGDGAGDAVAADAGDPLEIRQTTVTVGALVFDARVAGPADGEPVVLLHGFPQTSYEWRSQLAALAAAGYRAVAPDQRGYSPGARPQDVDGYLLPLLAQDVLGLADALGFDRFHLVGHDWGASVAWTVAATAPERLLSLAPMSVPHVDAFVQVLSDKTSCQYKASAYFDLLSDPAAAEALLVDDAAFLRGMYDGLAAADVDAYAAFFLADPGALAGGARWYAANIADRVPVGDPIGAVTVPTMYVWSDADGALCRDGAELTADFVTGPYRFEIIAGVGHWVPELAADQVNALLLEHLGSHPATR